MFKLDQFDDLMFVILANLSSHSLQIVRLPLSRGVRQNYEEAFIKETKIFGQIAAYEQHGVQSDQNKAFMVMI